MAQAYLELKNVTKEFTSEFQTDKVVAVQDFSLKIDQGEFITLLGPSGCGKTTTLRMIGGFEDVTSGEIYLDGVKINDLLANKRETCMVFQSYALFPHMNIYKNVAYGLELKGLPKKEIQEKVEKILRLVGLEGLGKRPTSQLSGGQQQRVALARAMVIEPKVLLFDEPLSNLDAKLRVKMRVFIRKLQQELGMTSIYVTHDQEEAMSLSDRIVVMNHGRIEQVGSPMEIYARPQSLFVADFIGKQTNFLEGIVQEISDQDVAIDIGKKVVFVKSINTLSKGDQVTFVIRPEMIELSQEQGLLEGIVQMVTYLGSEVVYEVLSSNHLFTVKVSNPLKHGIYHTGDQVFLNFDLENLPLIKS